MIMADDDDDLSTLVAQGGNDSQMIFQCWLQKKAKSHTRFIPNCCAVWNKEIH